MARSARTTITIPQPLKDRMDAAPEPVNWSAVACAAFELKLDDIDKRRVVKDMNDVISRLRASGRTIDSALYEAGKEAGEHWARTTADADELIRLAEYQEDHEESWFSMFGRKDGAYSDGERLYFVIDPDEAKNRKAAEDFWGDIVDNPRRKMTQGEYIRGFAEGAIKLWREVETLVRTED